MTSPDTAELGNPLPLDMGTPATETVLIIDDDSAMRSLLAQYVRELGLNVVEAENGLAGLARAREALPDVILLDLHMPLINGREILALLKKDPSLDSIPILVVSGSDENDLAAACIEGGADDYLSKPINPTLLHARLTSTLERMRMRRRENAHLRQIEDHALQLEQGISGTGPRERQPGMRRALDLTVRRDTEKHLAQMEGRYRGLLEAAPDAMVVVNPGGEIVLLNVQAEKQFGYRRDELVGQKVKNIIPEGFAERLVADGLRSTADALAQQIGTGIELTGRRKDGSEFPIEIMLSPLESAEGILVTAAIRNISVRKAAEKHLAQMEGRYRGLLEAAPDAMVVVNSGGEIVLLNVQAERQFGYRRDELVGQKVKNIIPEGFAERLIADALRSPADALAQQIGTGIELSGRRKDGSEFPIEIMLSPLASTEGILVTAAIRDISVRKSAERRLLESEEEYRLLFDSNPHPMWVFDIETLAFLAVNDAAVQLYGFSRDEFLGMTIKEIRPIEQVPPLLEYLETMPDSPSLPATQVKHRKKDGSLLEVAGASNRIEFHGRRARLVLANDVSEKKRLEAQLLQAQKLEAVGRLAGGVAHDFNNILGVIIGYGEMAQRQLDPEHPVRSRVDQMVKAAGRAAGLTRQLLAFSRKQVLHPRAIDLNAVVVDVDKMLGRLIGEDIDLALRPAPGLGTVEADPGQIEQIILNLAVNARDAMPEGGRLTIETANVDLDEDYAAAHPPLKPGRHVMLAVSDTGIGMDEETRLQIFEPFFTTKPEGQGTGLGLATVYGIVKQSGGYIWVYSEPGRGTTFKVYLPRLDERAEPIGAGAATVEAPRGQETILLVEDTAILQEVIRETLEERGYTVLLAANGEEALAVAGEREEQIHLLLTDVVMPKLGGVQLAKLLSASRPAIRVLYISGYTQGAISHDGVLGEGVMLLEKPFSGDQLARAVREALDRPGPT
jgi:two-component system cell cycle sensor histidine kinase/response regulator CckA